MKSILLLSGGVESTTLFYGDRASEAVFIDYGQRAAARERAAAAWHCARRAVPLTVLDLAAVGDAFRAGQQQRLHVPLPHRNLVALSLGASYATQQRAQRLSLALNRDDARTYASARVAFIERFQALLSTLGDIEIATPLIGLSKTQVIEQGVSAGVDFTRTYSCLLGYAAHCGRCPQCLKRRAAFGEAGVPEPNAFYRKD